MKKLLALGIGASLLFSGAVAMAQDAKAPTPGGTPAAAQSMPKMAQMDEHMKKMQALHDKMMSATTPEDRQKAMEEARKEVQAGRAMMKPMMRGGGMRGGRGGDRMGGPPAPMMPPSPGARSALRHMMLARLGAM